MQKRLLALFLFILSISISAQTGRISGSIIDSKTGETLPGATILIEGTTRGGSADFDGKFAINNVPAGKVNLIVNYISYTQKKIEGVVVKAGDVTDVNVLLDPSTSQDLKEVEVVVTLNKENNTALVLQQKNNASVSDGISAETIRRTPDRNTSDVLKRVSGASIQDNKFAIVRGLNERYNAAYLNGAPLPSSESDRKAFAFDIFPSNMLDNLVITKTARPDLPGEFAGGVIDITTKSIPEKNFVSVSVQGGYNTQATFKDRYYYEGGKTDWLGLDDGTRKLPDVIPGVADYPQSRDRVGQISVAKKFSETSANNWSILKGSTAPNLALQASAGYNFKRKERDFFGIIGAITYNSTNTQTTAVRTDYVNNTPDIPSVVSASLTDRGYTRQVLAGAMLNLACKVNPNNSISLKNLYSINSTDQTIMRDGITKLDAGPGSEGLTRQTALWFTSNRIFSSQLIGEHYIPAAKLRINWIGAYSNVIRDVPDLRRNVLSASPGDTIYTANLSPASVGNDYGGDMFWSHLTENIKSFKGDVQRNFKVSEKFNFDLKAGGYIQERSRSFTARQLGYTLYDIPGGISFDASLGTLPASQMFSTANMGILPNGMGGFKLTEGTKPQDSYDASSSLKAGYLMADVKVWKWLRVVGGVRAESYYQKIVVPDALFNINKQYDTYDTTKLDWLPSVNAIFALTDKQNIRASYSKTLNRPEFRELAPFAFYDFNTNYLTTGNLALQRAVIHNYDVRYEIYPGRGQLFSVSGFYKHFINPIELMAATNDNEAKYGNSPTANVYGVELEGRIVIGSLMKFKSDSSFASRFFNNLTVFANYAYIRSKLQMAWGPGKPDYVPDTRPLQGQAPYTFNAGITYADNDNGFSVSAIANRVGQRIWIVGNYTENPSIWENGRTAMDLQISKTFLKNRLEIRLTARDILAKWQPQTFFYDKNNNLKYDKDSDKDDVFRVVRFGTTYAAQITYKF